MTVNKQLLLSAVLALAAMPAPAQDASTFLRETARAYREQARYPESSWPLRDGQADQIKAERTPSVVTSGGQDGTPELALWNAEVTFQAPGDVDLFATLTQAARTVRVERLGALVSDESGQVVAKAVYADDGLGPDRVAGDGTYSARVSGLPVPELAAQYLVAVEAALPGGALVHGSGGFLYARPWAKPTGVVRDSLRDGNVVVAVEVEVARAGRFHLAGTLATLDGRALGSAQNALSLQPGRHWIELSFFGLMFHERGAAGPYRLASLALSTTGAMPNAFSPLRENAHVTRAYGLGELRSTPFERADLLAAAARLENDAARASQRR